MHTDKEPNEATKGIIQFYAEALDKDMNSSRQEFSNKIFSLADDAEYMDEEKRQLTIMEVMLHVFDDISMKDKTERSAWDSPEFRKMDSDVLTDWQLTQIQNSIRDHFPKVVQSCQTIIEEGF